MQFTSYVWFQWAANDILDSQKCECLNFETCVVHSFDPVEHISVEIVFRDKVCLVLYENVSEQMIKHHDTVTLRT